MARRLTPAAPRREAIERRLRLCVENPPHFASLLSHIHSQVLTSLVMSVAESSASDNGVSIRASLGPVLIGEGWELPRTTVHFVIEEDAEDPSQQDGEPGASTEGLVRPLLAPRFCVDVPMQIVLQAGAEDEEGAYAAAEGAAAEAPPPASSAAEAPGPPSASSSINDLEAGDVVVALPSSLSTPSVSFPRADSREARSALRSLVRSGGGSVRLGARWSAPAGILVGPPAASDTTTRSRHNMSGWAPVDPRELRSTATGGKPPPPRKRVSWSHDVYEPTRFGRSDTDGVAPAEAERQLPRPVLKRSSSGVVTAEQPAAGTAGSQGITSSVSAASLISLEKADSLRLQQQEEEGQFRRSQEAATAAAAAVAEEVAAGAAPTSTTGAVLQQFRQKLEEQAQQQQHGGPTTAQRRILERSLKGGQDSSRIAAATAMLLLGGLND